MNEGSAEIDAKFFESVGFLTISWAATEAGLDFMIAWVHHRLDGKKIENEMPRALQRKLDYLKLAAKKTPGLERHKERLLGILTDVKSASETRHDIIHGFLVAPIIEGMPVQMVRLLHEDGRHVEKPSARTPSEIKIEALKVNRLANQLLEIVRDLMGIPATK